jgi:hypothetical protein
VMVDYNVDTSSSIHTLDAIAYRAYTNLVTELSRNHTLSDQCKSRLVDFTCANEFQECPSAPKFSEQSEDSPALSSMEPLQPCNSFCREVLSLCGGYDTEKCDIYPSTECFSIPPSSKKSCWSKTDCPLGEFCFFYDSGAGACLKNESAKL